MYVKNYASGPTWLPGRIKEKCGNVMFEVVLENGRCVRKHIDQLLSRHESTDPVSSGSTDMESLEGPVTPHDSQVAPETTSNTQVPLEDVTSPVLPLPIEQDASTTTEDSTPTVDSPDYTTGNTTVDDTIGVGTTTTGSRSTTVADRTSDDNSARTTVRRSPRSHHPPVRYGEPVYY